MDEAPRTLVFGGAGAIGSRVADLLAEQGHVPVVVDRQAPAGDLGFVAADLGERGAAAAAVEEAHRRFGPSSALVNCAGVFDAATEPAIDWERFDAAIQVNLAAPLEACLAWADALAANSRGTIVNVSSAAALRGSRDVAYAASKAGLLGVTRSLARALAPRVTVVAVAPGLTDTPMAAAMAPERRAALAASTLVGREGTADEVAEAVAFLVARPTEYMTGATLVVDGGLSG